MRTLLFIFIGLLMLLGWYVSKILDARKQRLSGAPVSNQEETSLVRQLDEAATTFDAAAKSIAEERGVLKTAIADLSRQCSALSAREESGNPFSRTARAAILRLVLALYGVVERATTIANRPVSPAADDLLGDATKLITTATDAMSGIAERADETTLTHLEADLDVLRDRLSVLD